MSIARAILFGSLLAAAGCRAAPASAGPAGTSISTPLPPDQALRRIEESLGSAKTLRVQCRCEQIVRLPSGREERFALEGKVLLKDEGKILIAFRGVDPSGDPRGVSVVSDGSRVTSRLGFTLPPQECAPPKGFRTAIQGLTGRLGLAMTALLVASRLQVDGDRADLPAAPHVSDLAATEGDDSAASFTYRVADPAGKAIAAKLWYDKASLRPVKRIVTREEGSQSLSFVETYEEYASGVPVADSEFASPARFMSPPADVSKSRRIVTDSAGWTLLVEKPQDVLAFILVVAPGGSVTEDASGVQLKRGNSTLNLAGNRGLVLSGRGGFSSVEIPEGWARDLAEEYRKRASAQPDLGIRPWLLEELRRHPAPLLEQFLQRE